MNNIEKQLSPNDLQKLRSESIIEDNEVALIIGDVIIAENVVTKTRRVLKVSGLLLESTRQILRD
jgi:hypothetical protein